MIQPTKKTTQNNFLEELVKVYEDHFNNVKQKFLERLDEALLKFGSKAKKIVHGSKINFKEKQAKLNLHLQECSDRLINLEDTIEEWFKCLEAMSTVLEEPSQHVYEDKSENCKVAFLPSEGNILTKDLSSTEDAENSILPVLKKLPHGYRGEKFKNEEGSSLMQHVSTEAFSDVKPVENPKSSYHNQKNAQANLSKSSTACENDSNSDLEEKETSLSLDDLVQEAHGIENLILLEEKFEFFNNKVENQRDAIYTSLLADVDSGEELTEVVVSDVRDPAKFSVQVTEFKDRLSDIGRDLTTVYTSQPLQKLSFDVLPPVGCICVALYTLDGCWYRVRVMKHLGQGKCLVLYVDYGNDDEVDVCHLRRITSEFLKIPFQSLLCALCDVQSPSPDSADAWPMHESVLFDQLVLGKTFFASFKSSHRFISEPVLVKLFFIKSEDTAVQNAPLNDLSNDLVYQGVAKKRLSQSLNTNENDSNSSQMSSEKSFPVSATCAAQVVQDTASPGDKATSFTKDENEVVNRRVETPDRSCQVDVNDVSADFEKSPSKVDGAVVADEADNKLQKDEFVNIPEKSETKVNESVERADSCKESITDGVSQTTKKQQAGEEKEREKECVTEKNCLHTKSEQESDDLSSWNPMAEDYHSSRNKSAINVDDACVAVEGVDYDNVELCPYFRRSNCWYGNKCTKLHSDKDETSATDLKFWYHDLPQIHLQKDQQVVLRITLKTTSQQPMFAQVLHYNPTTSVYPLVLGQVPEMLRSVEFKMHSIVCNALNRKSIQSYLLSVGQLLIYETVNIGGRKCFRVSIKQIYDKDQTALVFLIDYGIEAVVSCDALRHFSKDLLMVPQLAILCDIIKLGSPLESIVENEACHVRFKCQKRQTNLQTNPTNLILQFELIAKVAPIQPMAVTFPPLQTPAGMWGQASADRKSVV